MRPTRRLRTYTLFLQSSGKINNDEEAEWIIITPLVSKLWCLCSVSYALLSECAAPWNSCVLFTGILAFGILGNA